VCGIVSMRVAGGLFSREAALRMTPVKSAMCPALLAVVLLAGAGSAPTDADDAWAAVRPRIVVLAQVESTEDTSPGVVTATCRITHVFKGSKDLQNKVFRVSSNENSMKAMDYISPPLKEGQIGIWPLRKWRGLLVREVRISAPYVPNPAREEISQRYEEARAWADAIEEFDKADKGQRLALLKRYALSEIAEVSSWAVHATAHVKPDGFMEFLDSLVSSSQLTLRGRIALDEVLCDLKGEIWQDSRERRELLQQCVSAQMTEFEARIVLRRLGASSQRKQIDHKFLFGLLKTAVANKGIPVRMRQSFCSLVAKNAKRNDDYEESFEYLTRLIKDGKEDKIQDGAAYAIRNFIALDDGRIDALKVLIGEIDNEVAIEALRGALYRAGERIPEWEEVVPGHTGGPDERLSRFLPALFALLAVLVGGLIFLLLRRKGRRA
jgi:hypothetical protein